VTLGRYLLEALLSDIAERDRAPIVRPPLHARRLGVCGCAPASGSPTSAMTLTSGSFSGSGELRPNSTRSADIDAPDLARTGCEFGKEQDLLSDGREFPRHVPDSSPSPRHINGRVPTRPAQPRGIRELPACHSQISDHSREMAARIPSRAPDTANRDRTSEHSTARARRHRPPSHAVAQARAQTTTRSAEIYTAQSLHEPTDIV
jgi:hypothetical protein